MNGNADKMAPKLTLSNSKYLSIVYPHDKPSNTPDTVHGNTPSKHQGTPPNDLPSAEQQAKKRRRVTINVSGEKYQTYTETLERFPKTLLGDAGKREQYFEKEEGEYFFDRDRNAFAAIIYYYQSAGQLYCPLTVPLHILVSEAKFFDLGQDALNQILDLEDQDGVKLPNNKLQREIWKLFDIPDSGIAANLMTIFSVLVIICSVVILCIETLPYFKGYDQTETTKGYDQKFPRYADGSQPMFNPAELTRFMRLNGSEKFPMNTPKSIEMPRNKTNWQETFDLCETGIVAWFTLEFLVRLLSCPDKLAFLKACMNMIDLLAILPYYITLIFHQQGLGLDNIRIIRLVRVFRIFKLSRHSRGLQILGLTLKASIKELGLLIFFLFIGVVLFSSAVYYVEDQSFQSIPDAFWWAIITMCTVGYGDNVPHTFFGKVIGSLCAICGVLTIALPVPVIVSNFDYFYQRERARKFHRVVKDGTYKGSINSVDQFPTSILDTEKFRRQEHIERQKKLKKLENRHKRQSRGLFQMILNKSGITKMEKKGEQKICIERESVV